MPVIIIAVIELALISSDERKAAASLKAKGVLPGKCLPQVLA